GIAEVWDAGELDAFMGTLIPRLRGTDGGGRGGRGGRGGPAAESGPAAIWAKEFAKTIEHVNQQDGQLYMLLPARPNAVEYRREQAYAAKVGGTGPGVAIKDVTMVLANLRRVKSPREIDILQHAVDITAEAFQRAYTVAVPGTWEYEIQAQFE